MEQVKKNYKGLQIMFICKMMALNNIWFHLSVISHLATSMILSPPGVLM